MDAAASAQPLLDLERKLAVMSWEKEIAWCDDHDPVKVYRDLTNRGVIPTAADDFCVHLDLVRERRAPYMNLHAFKRAMQAVFDRGQGTAVSERNPRDAGALCPRYPTGIGPIDERCRGGFYGVTVEGGEPGTGKSMQALACALEAAAAGWEVAYLDAELGDANFAMRVNCYIRNDVERFRGNPLLEEDGVVDEIHWLRVDGVPDLARLFGIVFVGLPWIGDRQLVVIDSVNAIAKLLLIAGDERDYFSAIRLIGAVAQAVRKMSDGRVAFLLVSELTRAGGIRGADLEYVADLDVRFKRCQTRDYTEIVIPKGREGGEDNYGSFLRDWRRGRFVKPMEEPI
jgi:hypothetical protein